MNAQPALLTHIEQLHTTALGRIRLQKCLPFPTEDVVSWCKSHILSPEAQITQKGKNWCIAVAGCVITVNASSCTIITAHRQRI